MCTLAQKPFPVRFGRVGSGEEHSNTAPKRAHEYAIADRIFFHLTSHRMRSRALARVMCGALALRLLVLRADDANDDALSLSLFQCFSFPTRPHECRRFGVCVLAAYRHPGALFFLDACRL